MADITDNPKPPLRTAALARRAAIHAAQGLAAAERLRDHFLAALPDMGVTPVTAGRPTVVSAFWSMGDEIDVKPLLAALHARGYVLGLPVVVKRGQPLTFRQWHPTTQLEAVAFGLLQPAADQPDVVPDVVITPLLAFDGRGHRLGYGAGYYDRTLAGLRDRGHVTAVGVGFADQRIDEVPITERDQLLDWMVTDQAAWRFPA
ncbi:MAG: 5-formyltetrahydrofolate cyclo-ligase [Rhodospirillales bacterium]|nr:5-formyltetrahydrofolate cyclo-ligase [Rhodospirillales bacterium]